MQPDIQPISTVTQKPDVPEHHSASQRLPLHSRPILLIFTLVVLCASAWLTKAAGFGWTLVIVSMVCWLSVAVLVLIGLRGYPHRYFGAANSLTTLRAAAACLIAGFIPNASLLDSPSMRAWLWFLTITVFISLLLDGIDGHVARTGGHSSAFGARYDMEIDSLLALIVAILLWRTQQAGIWILGLGLMRYAFLMVSTLVPALRAELYPSRRRKLICVIQVSALCAMLAPSVEPPLATAIGLAALCLLAWSFARDCRWLLANAAQHS
jgi:phosphatidylglycerophosphate synthase